MAYFRCTTGGSGKGNTLVVTCADELAGATITCTNGTKTYTKACPSTSPYEVTFYGLAADTWTVSATVSGNTYTITVVVADIEALLGGFNWKTWVDLSQNYTSSDFTDLDDLLSDETAIRELMTIHACVDYLAEIAAASADVEQIIENDYCAKWINNRDYALDTLYANTIIADYMDTADKYFYGEWVITDNTTTPPTWGPKGNVPVMTSATAPYGSVIGALNSSYPAYYAFDNNPSTKAVYSASSSSAPIYIGYVFTNPICVKAISWRANIDSPQLPPTAMQLEGSNDGATWESIGAQITNIPADTEKHIQEYNNDKYYLYLRCACTDRQYNSYWYIQFSELQFYGREMSVSVPEMTSDTTPYGECIWSTEASYAWYSFNTNDSINIWQPSDGVANNRIGYKFTHPVVAKKVHFTSYASANDQTSLNMKIQGYDGTNWVTLSTFTLERATAIKVYDIDLNNDIPYETYCLFTEDVYRSSTSPRSVKQLEGIQFYGLDYSEKEFEEGTTKKWLYDHGVELETITISRTGTKGTDAIQLTAANAQAVATIDTTDYSLMRGKVGSHASGTNQLICGSGASNFTASNMPYNNGFDVSSVNGSNAVGVKQTANGIFDVKEFWLE